MKRYLELQPISKKFYTQQQRRNGEKIFIEIVGKPVDIEFHGVRMDAVIHNAEKDGTDITCKWNIIEQHTGMKLEGGNTRKEAIDNTKNILKRVEEKTTPEEAYQQSFGSAALSPRYEVQS